MAFSQSPSEGFDSPCSDTEKLFCVITSELLTIRALQMVKKRQMVKHKLSPLLFLVYFVLLVCGACQKSVPPSKLYFVPIGKSSFEAVSDLVDHYHAKFGIQPRALPS
jgi:hypothetical protein